MGRWAYFVGLSSPLLFKLVQKLIFSTDNTVEITRELRFTLEKLGPTFIKLGQMMSVRPDIFG